MTLRLLLPGPTWPYLSSGCLTLQRALGKHRERKGFLGFSFLQDFFFFFKVCAGMCVNM